ncbi:MAG TPA: hypothetical protein VNA20_05325 [Frankiaceae bacterium]|nr:hypothetical protein [Frankiaceae bacterium]
MFKKLALATLAVGALALNAPAAQADAPSYDCYLDASQQADVTGQTFQGVLAGVIVHADVSASVTIRCYVTVNGVVQGGADTGVGSGTGVATAQKDVSFAAGDADVVKVCAQYTSNHGSGTVCTTVGVSQIPPQVVFDTIDGALAQVWPIVDPPVCDQLEDRAGTYGPVYINDQGDVYVDGEPQWDCPPYDVVWG